MIPAYTAPYLLYFLEHPSARVSDRDLDNTILPKQFIAFASNETLDTDVVFQSLNMLAIKDSLIQALGGAISGYGLYPAHTPIIQANHLQEPKVR